MDALEKAIAEMRAVREFDEEMLAAIDAEKEAEGHAIKVGMEGFFHSGVMNDTLTIRNMMDISAAFAAGWVGGREYGKSMAG